jgi:hypothetical protein
MNHHDAVCEAVLAESPSLICLQETKRVVFSDFDIMQLLGAGFDYVYLSAMQKLGGVSYGHMAFFIVVGL